MDEERESGGDWLKKSAKTEYQLILDFLLLCVRAAQSKWLLLVSHIPDIH